MDMHITTFAHEDLPVHKRTVERIFRFEAPVHIPEIGDIYEARKSFRTGGGIEYQIGDQLLVICRTDELAYDHLASLGNLCIEGKDRKITVWATLEFLIYNGLIHFKRTIF